MLRLFGFLIQKFGTEPRAEAMAGEGATASTDDRTSTIWSILPSFDPSSDDPREYVDKVKFLHSICPLKDKPMLAPRLAMLMKGLGADQRD